MTAAGPEVSGLVVPDGAFWIGPSHPFDLSEAYHDFRAELWLDGPPGQARIFISADSRYRLWINGVAVGRGPERSWPSSMSVDEHVVAGEAGGQHAGTGAALRSGRNKIAVQVYSPGYSHFAYVHRGACGLICWVEVDGKIVLTSDTAWKVHRDRRWSGRVARVSIYGTGVEDRDEGAGPAEREWTVSEAEGWNAARIVQPASGPIWSGLQPRRTPNPIEERIPLGTAWQLRLGPAIAPSDDPHEDLRRIFAASVPVDSLAGLDAGTTGIWIFDLGESRVCLAGLELDGSACERVLVSYAERLRGGEVLLPDPSTYCRMRPTDRFNIPKRSVVRVHGDEDDTQAIEGFTPRGARYLIFAIEGRGGRPRPRFHADVPRYPVAEAPLPTFADATLAAVAQMCRRTTLACLQDGFIDSIWRESSMWLGDVVAQDWALRAISSDPRPLLLAIELAARGADTEGLLPSVLPGEVPAYAVTDYNFSWVELLAGCASHPGISDPAAVWQAHWPVLRRMLAGFAGLRGPDGLIRNPAGRRLFLDWSAMDRGEPNLTLNLRYLRALDLADAMGGRLGAAETWAAEAHALRDAIKARLGHGGWHESPGGAEASQLALAFLILTGLAGDAAMGMADQIVARSLAPDDAPGPALASPFMHHYLFQALHGMGRGADILSIIRARWGRWVAAGDVTTRENWSIDFPDGSAAHGFSAHCLGWLVALGRT